MLDLPKVDIEFKGESVTIARKNTTKRYIDFIVTSNFTKVRVIVTEYKNIPSFFTENICSCLVRTFKEYNIKNSTVNRLKGICIRTKKFRVNKKLYRRIIEALYGKNKKPTQFAEKIIKDLETEEGFDECIVL